MSNKTIIKHPIHTFQTYIARERASYTPRKELGRSATASLPTLSGRCKRPFARDIYLYRVDRVSYIWYILRIAVLLAYTKDVRRKPHVGKGKKGDLKTVQRHSDSD